MPAAHSDTHKKTCWSCALSCACHTTHETKTRPTSRANPVQCYSTHQKTRRHVDQLEQQSLLVFWWVQEDVLLTETPRLVGCVFVVAHVDRKKPRDWLDVSLSHVSYSTHQKTRRRVDHVDRKKPPPRGGFLLTMFPDQEPCVRDFTTKFDRRISSWNLLHTARDQGT